MILGIDLGTTNSLASAIINGKNQAVMFEKSTLLPSVVAFNSEGNLLIGQVAKNQFILNIENTVKSIKRKMGSEASVKLQGKEYRPEEISALILKYIKEKAEQQFNQPIKDVVITVPAYFSDDQRKATTLAGKIAGLKVRRIVNEPTAAALSYNINQKKEIKAVVYDLGGGTFDVSIVNIANNVVEVLSSHGNNALGGDDFDVDLTMWLIEAIKKKYKLEVKSNSRAFHQLQEAAEKCKIELTDQPFYNLIESIIIDPEQPPLNIELEIKRSVFEELIHPYILETMQLVHVALTDAGLQTSDIDQILLVGGSSKIPLIKDEFMSVFSIVPSESINPDQCVCLGAAVQGGIIEDQKINAILVDITPYTFGTRASVSDEMDFLIDNDVFVPLIQRNTPLPVSKSEIFYKNHPEQEKIKVDIHQGDHSVASENKLIGSFNIEDLSKKAADTEIILSMNLDLNGILTVVATEKNTGANKQITIDNAFKNEDVTLSVQKVLQAFGQDDNPESEMNPSEILDNEEEDPTETAENNRIYIANTMIEKAESKMSMAAKEDAEQMKRLIGELGNRINENDIDNIIKLTDELTDILFYID
ncbi:MAG: Hsp70 family protein [Deltaproteobacteria bacterium]|jgi:molecular chaperone DnaK|nr:Hsp70 family protein [Deltaproteobacteria bacterium]MBT4526406.1 Hsp70 family protein [Deltaproteobacteria bacterium]